MQDIKSNIVTLNSKNNWPILCWLTKQSKKW